MDIYFLRHGETPWNRERRIQGATEWTDLTSDGVKMAECVRDGMLGEGIRFEHIFSSPYRRALHTAEIIAKAYGLEVETDRRLCEISFGPYEGTRYGEGLFIDANIQNCFLNPPEYTPPQDAESFAEVRSRVEDFIENVLAPLEKECKKVLAVAHGGVLRTVRAIAMGVPLKGFWRGSQPNCCAHVVSLEGGKLVLKEQSKVFSVFNY